MLYNYGHMERPPKREVSPDVQQERELSFDQQLALATALSDAVDKRNVFIQAQGGFDTFAEAGQHVDGMRDEYDKMEDAVSRARKEFDEKIPDKGKFIEQLRNTGNDALADMISVVFNFFKDSRSSVFSRIFKK